MAWENRDARPCENFNLKFGLRYQLELFRRTQRQFHPGICLLVKKIPQNTRPI